MENKQSGSGSSSDFEMRFRKLALGWACAERRYGFPKRHHNRTHGQRKHGHQKGTARKKAPPKSLDSVQVFCRIRPFNVTVDKCLRRIDDKTVQLTPPSTAARNGVVKETQYKFAFAFDEDATQREIFEDVGLPLVRDLILGKNGILFTYGITSSGKTFTMQGRPDNPGILPRALDVLFNSIQNVLAARCTFKPDGFNGFDVQSDMDAIMDRQRRDRDAEKTGRGKGKDGEAKLGTRFIEDGTVDSVDGDCLYSVFVSYLEIYNNYAYDLLQVDTDEPGKAAVLQTKLLREDSTNHIYVAGAAEFEVQSAEEALRLLRRGQKMRRVASTQLNADSSRSHAIFNIRLVQAPLDETGTRVVEDKDIVQISLLSLIDLAGSERTKRTDNKGDRLREAGNINSSLLTLRKCLNMLRAIQKGESLGEIVPYRDSKLTHLFKSYFEGEGKVRMVVCLNPSAEEYSETVNVLSFAEAAQEIQVCRSEQVRFEQLGFAPGRRAAAEESMKRKALQDNYDTEEFSTRCLNPQTFVNDYDLLLTFPNIKLNHHTDSLTLPELARFLTERIARHKAIYESMKEQEIEFCSRIRFALSGHERVERENVDLRDDLEERNRKISNLEKELAEQIRVRNILMHHSSLSEQAKVELMGELDDREYALGQEHLKGDRYRSRLKADSRQNADRYKRERDMVQEMQETRDQFSQKSNEQRTLLRRIRGRDGNGGEEESPLSSVIPFHSSNNTTVARSLSSQRDYRTEERRDQSSSRQVLGGASQQIYVPGLQRNYAQSRAVAPGSHLLTQNSRIPLASSRYGTHGRRSKSHDHVLEPHSSKSRIPVGTRLQPVYGIVQKRKSVTKVEFTDTKQSETFVLEHQPVDDSEDEVQARNFLPTIGGCRAMVFADMETQNTDELMVERKRKVYEESGRVTEVLTERVENGQEYRLRPVLKKAPSKAAASSGR